MRILWFSNSSAAAYSDALKGTGGWMVALDRAIQNKVELHVAYKHPYKQEPFQNGKTWYHPIYTGNIIWENIKHRFFPEKQKDFSSDYQRIIEEIKPDVVHIHGSENDFHCIANKTNCPIVLSIQGNLTVFSNKFFSGFHGKYLNTSPEKITLKTIVFGRSSFRKGFCNFRRKSKIELNGLLHISNIIGRTDWDRRISRVQAPQSRYYVCNEMLRESFYNYEWEMLPPKQHIIIHTTNDDCYYKGFETICHTLTLLNRMGLKVEWRVAGVSENSAVNKITKKYLGNDYPQKGLVLMGALDEKGLIDSLLSSHIYVMPSHIENSPNNLCEAMLLGMPCIATHAGGTDSIMINKKEGLLIQDGDPWSMAGSIIELINDWQQAIEYGHNARKHALERHDRDTIVNDLITIYQTIVDNSQS